MQGMPTTSYLLAKTMQTTIQVEDLIDLDNYSRIGFYCKGHIDPIQFYDAVVQEYGDDECPDLSPYTLEDIKHCYFTNEEKNEDGKIPFVKCKADEPGAYPVTVLDY